MDDETIKTVAGKIQNNPPKDIVLSITMSPDGKWAMTLPDKLPDTILLQKFLNIKIDDLVKFSMYPQKPK